MGLSDHWVQSYPPFLPRHAEQSFRQVPSHQGLWSHNHCRPWPRKQYSYLYHAHHLSPWQAGLFRQKRSLPVFPLQLQAEEWQRLSSWYGLFSPPGAKTFFRHQRAHLHSSYLTLRDLRWYPLLSDRASGLLPSLPPDSHQFLSSKHVSSVLPH